jgi:hypothetical protein
MATMTCPHCNQTVDAKRLNWNELTDQRHEGWDAQELEMGPHHFPKDPAIQYYRRLRQCSSCGDVYVTGEVSEARLDELVRLRARMQELGDEAKRLSSATKKMRKLLTD